MLVCLIHIDASWQPEYFFRSQIRLQFLFDLFFGKLRVPAFAEQTGFRHHDRPFSVTVNGTAFQHKRCRIITDISFSSGKIFCKSIIQSPGCIQTIFCSAPGIERPVHCTDISAFSDKRRCHISCPGIICFCLKNKHRKMSSTCDSFSIFFFLLCGKCLCPCKNLFPGSQINRLTFCDCLHDCTKSPLGIFCIFFPGARPLRPDHDAAFMRLILCRHMISVRRRCCSFLFHHILLWDLRCCRLQVSYSFDLNYRRILKSS